SRDPAGLFGLPAATLSQRFDFLGTRINVENPGLESLTYSNNCVDSYRKVRTHGNHETLSPSRQPHCASRSSLWATYWHDGRRRRLRRASKPAFHDAERCWAS